jgi:hypothetical protein
MFITQAKTVTAEMIKIINTSFTQTYEEYYRPVDTGWFEAYYVIKKERHRYHIWVCGKTHTKLVAKNIQRRREALAIIKLLKATKEN